MPHPIILAYIQYDLFQYNKRKHLNKDHCFSKFKIKFEYDSHKTIFLIFQVKLKHFFYIFIIHNLNMQRNSKNCEEKIKIIFYNYKSSCNTKQDHTEIPKDHYTNRLNLTVYKYIRIHSELLNRAKQNKKANKNILIL